MRGVETIKGYVGYNVQKGRTTASQAQRLQTLLKPTLDYEDLRGVDIVIEAVFENMKVKKEIFARLDSVCKPDAILASNTSGLNIDEVCHER